MAEEELKMYNPNAGKVDIARVWQTLQSITATLDTIQEEAFLRLIARTVSNPEMFQNNDIKDIYNDIINDIYREKIEEIIHELDSCVEK